VEFKLQLGVMAKKLTVWGPRTRVYKNTSSTWI